MKYELDLINYTFEEELERQGIFYKRLSGKVSNPTDEELFNLVIDFTKKVFDIAQVPYINKITVERKEPNVKPINYVMKFTCEDKDWVIENAFSGRHTEFNVFVGLAGTLDKILNHYGEFCIIYAQVCYYDKENNITIPCRSYDVVLSGEQKKWFSESGKKYNFAKRLHESNEKVFKNICVKIRELVQFEAKLNYKLLTEKYNLDKAKKYISDSEKFIHGNIFDIEKYIFAASQFILTSELFLCALEIFSLLDLKPPLVETIEDESSFNFFINKEDENLNIKIFKDENEMDGNGDFKTIFSEINFILYKFAKEERLFHVKQNYQNYFFLATKNDGLEVINEYNAIGNYELDKNDPYIKREISYYEKGQPNIIGKIHFIFPEKVN